MQTSGDLILQSHCQRSNQKIPQQPFQPRQVGGDKRHHQQKPVDAGLNYQFLGRICGNNNTSRMLGELVNNITSRSIPMPSPAVGGMPCSNAVM